MDEVQEHSFTDYMHHCQKPSDFMGIPGKH
jgi:hypothetical protein